MPRGVRVQVPSPASQPDGPGPSGCVCWSGGIRSGAIRISWVGLLTEIVDSLGAMRRVAQIRGASMGARVSGGEVVQVAAGASRDRNPVRIPQPRAVPDPTPVPVPVPRTVGTEDRGERGPWGPAGPWGTRTVGTGGTMGPPTSALNRDGFAAPARPPLKPQRRADRAAGDPCGGAAATSRSGTWSVSAAGKESAMRRTHRCAPCPR